MVSYILKRIVMAIVTLLFVICLTFALMETVPGGPFLGEKAISKATLAELNAKYGLDKPLGVQMLNYIKNVAHGDFGVSLKMQKNRPVMTIIMEMFPVSARIGGVAMIWALIVGIVFGCLAAYNRGTWIDSILQIITTLGIAFPSFVVATGLDGGAIAYVLPCTALGLSPMCSVARYTRSSMLDVLGKDYIRTARAYGHSTVKMIFKYSLRNAIIPVITYVGPMTAAVLTGSFVVETVFSIPGIGRYFIQSINNRDYPLIMGTTIFLASLVIIMSLVVDILYKIIDPRIQLANENE